MCIFRALSHLGVATRQQERIGIADLRAQDAKIRGRVKETGVPAVPVRKDLFDFILERHVATVTKRLRRNNDAVGLTFSAMVWLVFDGLGGEEYDEQQQPAEQQGLAVNGRNCGHLQ